MYEEEIGTESGTGVNQEEGYEASGENIEDGESADGSNQDETGFELADGEAGDGSSETGESEESVTAPDYTELLETIEVNTERLGINDGIDNLTVEGVLIIVTILLLFMISFVKEKL